MKKIAIDLNLGDKGTAATKLRNDYNKTLESLGYEVNLINFREPKNYVDELLDYLRIFKDHKKIIDSLPADSVVFLQYSWYGTMYKYAKYFEKMKKKKNLKFITVIHDLDTVRKQNIIIEIWFKYFVKENKFLNSFDYVICHNDVMKKHLISKGINENKLISIGIFDYIVDYKNVANANNYKRVIIAGNLSDVKAGYVYKLNEIKSKKYHFDLYGPNYNGISNSFIKYNGVFKPNELPQHLISGFGLVWDGTSYDTCNGNMGNYLRMNNPHKLSLYMTCGIPVIVWKESALSTFVLKNKVGFAVESLEDIEKVISKISKEDYKELLKNVKKIQDKVLDAGFFKEALSKVEKELNI